MNLKKSSQCAADPRLADAVVDGYVSWREESAAAAAAYQRWRCAASHERGLAYDAYVVALDREEYAASAYRRVIEQVQAA
jgi:hypothetical protein